MLAPHKQLLRKSPNSVLGCIISEDLSYSLSFYDILLTHREIQVHSNCTLNQGLLQSQNERNTNLSLCHLYQQLSMHFLILYQKFLLTRHSRWHGLSFTEKTLWIQLRGPYLSITRRDPLRRNSNDNQMLSLGQQLLSPTPVLTAKLS